MADNENVTIRIRVDADTSEIDRVKRKLASLTKETEVNERNFDQLTRKTELLTKQYGSLSSLLDETTDATVKLTGATQDDTEETDKSNKSKNKLSKALDKNAKAFKSISKIISGPWKLALKGAAIETAGLLLALSSVNGMLITGQFLAKAWSATVRGMGVATANAAAAIAATIALFTQAMRQFTAAQASARYGGNFEASSTALRTVQTDAKLAVFGIQALTGAFGAASRNARVTAETVTALRGLSDFAIMSGDLEKGLAAAANFVSLLQAGKKSGGEEILSAAAEIGPEFEKAYKEVLKTGKKTNAELLDMMAKGDLAKAAGIQGTTANVSGTLMGQLKILGTEAQLMFADLGQTFITPVQEGVNEIRQILKRFLIEISASTKIFAEGDFISFIVSGVDKLATFFGRIINDYLPKTTEVVNNFKNGWGRMVDFFTSNFKKFSNGLKRFSEASSIVNKFLGGILKAFGRGFKDNFIATADLVVANRDKFLDFGKSIESLIAALFNLFQKLRAAFFDAMPTLSRIAGIFETIVNAIASIVSMLTNLPGSLGGLVAILGPLMLGMGLMGKGKGLMKAAKFIGPSAIGAGLGFGGGQLIGDWIEGDGGGVRGVIGKMVGNASNALLLPMLAFGLTNQMDKNSPMGGGKPFTRGASKYVGKATAALAIALAGYTGVNEGTKAIQRTDLTNRETPGWLSKTAGAVVGQALIPLPGVGAVMGKDMFDGWFKNQADLVSGAAGVAGGAATGALAGSMIAPGVGTLVGAVVGAVGGALLAWKNSRDAKNKAKEAGGEFAKLYGDSMKDILRGGGLRQVQRLMKEFPDTLNEVAKDAAYRDLLTEEARTKWEEQQKELNPVINQFERNLNDLTKATGKSEQEIIALAQAAEIDLGSNLMSLQDIMAETGLAVLRVGDDFDQAFTNILADATSRIKSALGIVEAPNVINEATRTVAPLLAAGTATTADLATYLETVMTQSIIAAGDDPVAAAQSVMENIGYLDPSGKFVAGHQFTTQGSQLFGLQSAFMTPEMLPIFSALQGGVTDPLVGLLGESMTSLLAGQGLAFAGGNAALMNRLAGLSYPELLNFAEQASSQTGVFGQENPTAFGFGGVSPQSQQDYIATNLEQILGDNILLQKTENQVFVDAVNALDKIFANFGIDFNSKIEGFGVAVGEDGFAGAVTRFNDAVNTLAEAIANGFGDTRSPRRTLVDTMASHASYNSMIPGSRTVTSGYRTSHLGSMSSDHAAGRAYDLIGQNLGAYQQMVKQNGGFSEFHGTGGSRHLHVVPGAGPVGDTATPSMSSASPSGTTSVSNDSYTLNVYPSNGMDEKALADLVMDRIERKQRSARERA